LQDVKYESKGDATHMTTVNMPGGTPFMVEFQNGWGGHYPEPKKQAKPGQATKGKWVKGIPDDVAASWQANQQPWKQGYIIVPRPTRAPVKKKAKK